MKKYHHVWDQPQISIFKFCSSANIELLRAKLELALGGRRSVCQSACVWQRKLTKLVRDVADASSGEELQRFSITCVQTRLKKAAPSTTKVHVTSRKAQHLRKEKDPCISILVLLFVKWLWKSLGSVCFVFFLAHFRNLEQKAWKRQWWLDSMQSVLCFTLFLWSGKF